MAKRVKRTTVKRAFEDRKRAESTAGLMALRIIVMILIILLAVGAAAYAVLEFKKANEEQPQPDSDADPYYQSFSAQDNEKLLEYCNSSVPIDEYYQTEVEDYNGVKVSKLMYESLKRMADAAAEDGISIEVLVGYMSYEECDLKYNTVLLQLEEEGHSAVEAEILARSTFPPADSNEYRTGMIIKVSNMDSSDFAKTDVYTWLYKNGINFGFINRYTAEKAQSTGMEEDLTVYRFVGTENAKKMRSFNMSLEEYCDYCSYH